MYRRHGDKLALVFLACDLAVTGTVWVGAYLLRFGLWPAPQGVPELHLVLRALPLVLVLAAVAYRLCGLYEVHRLKQLPRELGVVLRASGLLFLLAITVAFYRRDLYESRLALALFLGLNALTLMLVRRAVWQALKYLRGRGLNRGRAVIVGSGRAGRLVAQTIRENAWTGLEAVGFVDRPGKIEPEILPRLGEIHELDRVVAEHDVDHVFVALPLSRYGELPEVCQVLSHILVEVQLVPDLPQTAGMKLRMLEVDNVAFLGLRQSPHYGWPRLAKRATDLALGGAALLLLAPLMAALALAVKLSSRGPVFYRQARMGLRGRSFNMLKFRTMPPDAERTTGPVWASRDDRRCTPLGRLLRRWSLDELPQLINVLAGDMSLVGPRPERGVFVEQFRRRIPDYAQRHQVHAGMTGWAQVHGWRGDTSLRHRTRCDLYYISHWSLWLDLRILWMTLCGGLRQRSGGKG
jgi:Undecaprenyl-phosphate glucose phosphotransferase